MLGILSSVFRTATRQEGWNPGPNGVTHDDLALQHERRKQRELRDQLNHQKRFTR